MWKDKGQRLYLLPTITLILILIVSAGLRFWEIGAESLWNDELSSWVQGDYNSIEEVVNEGVRPDVHPPGYQILLHFVIKYVGETEVVLRLPSAIAGILSVFVLYLIGTRLYSRKEGLTAAAILAVSWGPIFYAQEARAYSILMLTTSVSFYYWYIILGSLLRREKLTNHIIAGYIFFSIISSYVHYFGLLFIVLQAMFSLVVFIRDPRSLFRLMLIFFVVFLAYLPWIPSMLVQLRRHKDFWIPDPHFFEMIVSLGNFAYKVPKWFSAIFIIPAYVYFALRTSRKIYRDKGHCSTREMFLSPDMLLLLWAITPFLVSYVQSKISTPVLTKRNLIIALPPIYLILARSIWVTQWKRVATAWSLLVVAGVGYSLLSYYSVVKKEQVREAVEFVVEKDKSLTVIAYAWHKGYFEYYFGKMGLDNKVSLIAGGSDDFVEMKNFLEHRGDKQFWYVAGCRKPKEEFLSEMNDNFELVDTIVFKKTSVRRYLVP